MSRVLSLVFLHLAPRRALGPARIRIGLVDGAATLAVRHCGWVFFVYWWWGRGGRAPKKHASGRETLYFFLQLFHFRGVKRASPHTTHARGTKQSARASVDLVPLRTSTPPLPFLSSPHGRPHRCRGSARGRPQSVLHLQNQCAGARVQGEDNQPAAPGGAAQRAQLERCVKMREGGWRGVWSAGRARNKEKRIAPRRAVFFFAAARGGARTPGARSAPGRGDRGTMSSIARARTTGVAHPLASLLFFQCFIDQGVLEKKKKRAPLSLTPRSLTVQPLRQSAPCERSYSCCRSPALT